MFRTKKEEQFRSEFRKRRTQKENRIFKLASELQIQTGAGIPAISSMNHLNSSVVRVGEGRGVLVPGPFILTATHCIPWEDDGGTISMKDLLMDNLALMQVETADGTTFF